MAIPFARLVENKLPRRYSLSKLWGLLLRYGDAHTIWKSG